MDRRAEYERIGEERAAAEREATRHRRRDFLRSAILCVASAGAGMFVMFWAFWVDDREIGMAFLYGGMAVGYSGIAYAILSLYKRGEQRGDW
jgi:hypothetical protein